MCVLTDPPVFIRWTTLRRDGFCFAKVGPLRMCSSPSAHGAKWAIWPEGGENIRQGEADSPEAGRRAIAILLVADTKLRELAGIR
ncbi:hypothetical protein EBT31_07495 [bacterium]|nr:hypothetical protein [bacterium]